ncbi:ImmA/IrrE family metallo-endopeptidase [Actinoplanes sp. NPDC051633]|uniref:ImmA/IrrE family metallo-endopeptidase n=1 Tax=Actinoplanes sp. NPDC051633 TaxID=3155670 RepID=UPI00342972F0
MTAEGIALALHEFSGNESGFALSQGDQRIIGVNTATAYSRQRFTIAHELGHILLHHKPLIVDHSILLSKRDDISSLGTDQEEIEANGFAAALLMPDILVRQELERATRQDNSLPAQRYVVNLARTFKVSSQAMAYRLVNLNLITGWV